MSLSQILSLSSCLLYATAFFLIILTHFLFLHYTQLAPFFISSTIPHSLIFTYFTIPTDIISLTSTGRHKRMMHQLNIPKHSNTLWYIRPSQITLVPTLDMPSAGALVGLSCPECLTGSRHSLQYQKVSVPHKITWKVMFCFFFQKQIVASWLSFDRSFSVPFCPSSPGKETVHLDDVYWTTDHGYHQLQQPTTCRSTDVNVSFNCLDGRPTYPVSFDQGVLWFWWEVRSKSSNYR